VHFWKSDRRSSRELKGLAAERPNVYRLRFQEMFSAP
jgi:hypothetical protein